MVIERKNLDKMDFSNLTSGRRLPAVRPGDILQEDFMEPLGLTAHALALHLHVPASRIGEILKGEKPRPITADTAGRLATFFGTSADFWLGLQNAYDIETKLNWEAIRRTVRPYKEVVNV